MKSPPLVLLLVALCLATPGLCASIEPGWPQATGSWVNDSPAVGDLFGDGRLEVVAGSYDGRVYAWRADGTPVPGWPQAANGAVWSSPALADLNGDGKLEVVVGSGDGSKVYAWHADGTLLAGWPQTTGDHVWSSPAVGDLFGNGQLEVVVGCDDGKVYAWHADGTLVAGWPQSTGNRVTSSPALADLDGDGKLEIVAGSVDGKVYAWHADGTPVAGWPQAAGTYANTYVESSPAVGDLFGDGHREVVVGSDNGKVYAWYANGAPLPGWPRSTGGEVHSSPALADLDGDGKLEVVAGSLDGNVYAWHADGTPVADWPQATGDQVWSSPALGDLEGTGKPDVVIGSSNSKVFAWRADGTPLAGWPQSVSSGWIFGSPVLADVDGDGRMEVVAGAGDYKVYVWKCDTATGDRLPWPTFHQNPQRTGVATPGAAGFVGAPTSGTPPLLVSFTYLPATTATSTAATAWTWHFGDGATATEQNPSHTYSRFGLFTVTLTTSGPGGSTTITKPGYVTVTFDDVPVDFWALRQVLACVNAGIVAGYSDGTYRSTDPVTRDQMAVYISRAVAGGDANVPPGPSAATFTDVPTDYWAYKYVAYAKALGVVTGYSSTTYAPAVPVDRGQMAVFIARAIASPAGDGGLAGYTPPSTPDFPDVPADFWAYKYIEYIKGRGIAGGYPDGAYHPELVVTRDQMAVYIARAFKLP